jgi:hypothetical protein
MVIDPHPPYLQYLAPCDFALFPKMKTKLKGRHFETVSAIQRESQAVLDSIKENDFHGASEAWKKDGIAVDVPKMAILKEMAASISFLDLVRKLPNSTSQKTFSVLSMPGLYNEDL